MMFWTVICLQILAKNIVEMASDGAKRSACANMFPGHYVTEQNGGHPYVMSLSSSKYYPMANITVSVKSNDLTGFKGFLCQARRDLEEYVTYGKLTPAGNVKMENNCEQNASLTHTEASVKPAVSFVWTAPRFDMGDISIVCTIVQQFGIFWTNVTSPRITFSETVTQSTGQVMSSTETLKTSLSSLSTSSTKSTIVPVSTSSTKSTVIPVSSSSLKSTGSLEGSSLSSLKSSESSTSPATTSINTSNVTAEATTSEPFASSEISLNFTTHGYIALLILHIAIFAT